MTGFRQVLKDRIAGTAILAILAQVLALQLLVAGVLCGGAAAEPAAGTAFVLCHGAPDSPDAPVSHNGRAGCLDCPCGIGCAAGGCAGATGASTSVVTVASQAPRFIGPDRDGPDLAAPMRRLRPAPTGPPRLFV